MADPKLPETVFSKQQIDKMVELRTSSEAQLDALALASHVITEIEKKRGLFVARINSYSVPALEVDGVATDEQIWADFDKTYSPSNPALPPNQTRVIQMRQGVLKELGFVDHENPNVLMLPSSPDQDITGRLATSTGIARYFQSPTHKDIYLVRNKQYSRKKSEITETLYLATSISKLKNYLS